MKIIILISAIILALTSVFAIYAFANTNNAKLNSQQKIIEINDSDIMDEKTLFGDSNELNNSDGTVTPQKGYVDDITLSNIYN